MHRGHANQPTSFDQEAYDVARVASRLRLTVGRVRQLLWAGDWAQAEQPPKRYLCGRRVPTGRRYSRLWPRGEADRSEAEHTPTKQRPGDADQARPPKRVSVIGAARTRGQHT